MPLSDEQERLERIGEQLRAKIASKFTSSTFLAGFALTVLSGQVFALWQSQCLPALFPAAVGVVLAAAILFVEAVLQFDVLTMPKALWEAPGTPAGSVHLHSSLLTDADLSNLYRRMVFVWFALTIVAIAGTAVAVLLMLIPFAVQSSAVAQTRTIAFAIGGVVVGFAYCLVIRAIAKKKYPELVTGPD